MGFLCKFFLSMYTRASWYYITVLLQAACIDRIVIGGLNTIRQNGQRE